jgi:hypothetical protein
LESKDTTYRRGFKNGMAYVNSGRQAEDKKWRKETELGQAIYETDR